MRELFKVLYRLDRMWFNGVIFDDRQQMFDNAIIHCHVCGVNLTDLLDSSDYTKLCDYFNVYTL